MRALALAIATSLMLVTQAAAAPPGRHAGESLGPVKTDGVRWAAWDLPDQRTRVVDTWSWREWTIDSRPHCTRVLRESALSSIGAGRVLWSCPLESALIYDVASGAWSRPPEPGHPRPGSSGGPPSYEAVGAHWLRFGVSGYRWRERGYVDFAGSHVVYPDRPRSPRLTADLDDPGLFRRLCRPLRRRRYALREESTGSEPTYAAIHQYEPPYALDVKRTQVRSGNLLTVYDGLVLDRCGTARSRLLSRCRQAPCSDAQLGAGWVSWLEYPRARAYFPGAGARSDLVVRGLASAAHTRDALFFTTRRRAGQPLSRVYVARVDRRRGTLRQNPRRSRSGRWTRSAFVRMR